MSDITLLGFDPAGIGKEREKMKTLKDMSGEELLADYGKAWTGAGLASNSAREYRAELLRKLALAERTEAAEALTAHGTSLLLAEQARVSELIADRNRAEAERDSWKEIAGNMENQLAGARIERDKANFIVSTALTVPQVELIQRLETARTALTAISKLQVGREFMKAPGAKMSELFVESRQIATNALAALTPEAPEVGAEKLPER